MKTEAKLSRMFLVSPWTLLIFIAFPLLVILSITLRIQLPLQDPFTPLLVNNICFALVVAARLLRYLVMAKKTIRYEPTYGKPHRSFMYARSGSEIRATLEDNGYAFAPAGDYGEKRDHGYIGTMVMYGGLLFLLSIGTWDNLQHFSGIVFDSMGPGTNLNKASSYRSITRSFLAPIPTTLPQMQIVNQVMPNSTYPMGATDLILNSSNGTTRRLLLTPRDPAIKVGAYDIYMAKLVFEAEIVIKRPDLKPLFDEIVPLNPLVQKRGVYSFYGPFQGYNLEGGVYYQPEKSSLLVVVTRNNKKVVSEMTFQIDQQVEQGDFVISCAKMGQWSEIHVVHRRHKGLLMIGALIAVIGLFIRVVIRPQRVWLEETAEGCLVWGKKIEG